MGRKRKTLPYYDVKTMYITEGRTMNDIAKHYDVSGAHIRNELIRMGLIVTPETPKTTKKENCQKCIYRSSLVGDRQGVLSNLSCDYILITGRSRGCPIEHCTHYTKGRKIDQRRLRSPQKE